LLNDKLMMTFINFIHLLYACFSLFYYSELKEEDSNNKLYLNSWAIFHGNVFGFILFCN
jgi:hypothetical protein